MRKSDTSFSFDERNHSPSSLSNELWDGIRAIRFSNSSLDEFEHPVSLGFSAIRHVGSVIRHGLSQWSFAYTISKHKILSSARYYSMQLENNQKHPTPLWNIPWWRTWQSVKRSEFYNFGLTYYQWMCLPFQYLAVHQQSNLPTVPFFHPHCFVKRSTVIYRPWVLESRFSAVATHPVCWESTRQHSAVSEKTLQRFVEDVGPIALISQTRRKFS